MTLAYYREGDVTFSDAGEIDVQGFRHYNYGIIAWTRLQGAKIAYRFLFEKGQLRLASGDAFAVYTDNYVEVPLDLFPWPVPLPFTYDFRTQ
jgi:hypothetical protein